MAIRVRMCPGCNSKIKPADRRPEGLFAGSGQGLQPTIQPNHLSGSPEDGKYVGLAEKRAFSLRETIRGNYPDGCSVVRTVI